MSDWIDISLFISPQSVVWPGAPKTEFSQRRSMAKGDRSNNSNFFMNAHAGTHVDAPLHFVKEGLSIDQLPMELFLGKAYVFDLSGLAEIDAASLQKVWTKEKVERVLIKTSNSLLWQKTNEFVQDYCALTESAAQWLLKEQVRLIGIDYLSIQKFGTPPQVHQILLGNGIVLIEGLDLSRVTEGCYELLCLPLKLKGLEAAPARAVLRKIC